jgi:hypothetical protein
MGLRHLDRCSKLKILSLEGTEVTDKGIGDLKKHKSLKQLVLFNTKVSEAGVKELKTALPDTDILR